MSNRITDQPPPRFSVSMLPAEVDPEEKAFARLLTQALAPSFVLVKRLGSGGMGAVYLARDPVLRRLVAVKVLAPQLASDPEARARFEREGQAVAAISHPNVVAVHSVGELENGVPYIVMQYIEGRTMAERLQEDGPLDARSAKHVIGEVASALAAAHKKGIIHRDIKPANILLDEDTGRAMVTDFGIAAVKQRGAPDDKPADITQAGTTLGTPAYMSPEQVLAEPITEKTDIYSLGLLAYQLFIADGPYQISSPKEVMVAHVRDTPRPLHTMRGDVEPELERLIENCLAKDPRQRPSAAEVEKRLQHGASILLEWPPPGLEKLRTPVRAAMNVMSIGAFTFSVPFVALSVFDRESFVRQTLPTTGAVVAVSTLGLVLFTAGIIGLVRVFGRARTLVAAGYGWGTILETVSDKRGDTGALIAGAREYAELSPKRRTTMRRSRIAALLFRLLAGLAPIFGYVLGAAFSRGSPNAPIIVLWSSLLLALTLLLQARLVAWYEDRVMQEPRRRLRSAHARPNTAAEKLAETWTESFEQVRLGQTMGAGPRWQGRPLGVAVWTTAALTTVVGVFLFMILMLTNLVHIAQAVAIPRFSNTSGRVAKVQRLRDYRVPIDTTVTPVRAAQALQAVSRNGPGGRVERFEREPVISIPPQPRRPDIPDPFPATEGGWANHAFAQARRGFSAQQRDFLKRIADNSAIEEFRLLARAPGLDLPGAYWDLNSEARWGFLPIPKFTPVREAGRANLAQAALDLSAGNSVQAERRIREVVSAGFLLMDDAHTLIESLVGAAMVSNARTSLHAFFQATGRERDARFVSQQNDPEPPTLAADLRPATFDESQRTLRAVILDTTNTRGLRWELLHSSLAIQPCADLHQVVFGPDSLQIATLEAARRTLVRRTSDSVFFDFAAHFRPVPITASGSRGAAVRMTKPVTALLAAMTGNRQLEACLSLFGGF